MSRRLGMFVRALMVAFVVGIVVSGCRAAESTPQGSVRVRVVGSDGDGLAGAKVVSNTQPDGQLKVTGITDQDGVVMFTGVKLGEYQFYVSRFDYDQEDFSLVVRGNETSSTTIMLALAVR